MIANRDLTDTRLMPSRYLLDKIRLSSQNNNYAELLLSINISIMNRQWSEIHPEHLKIILNSIKSSYSDELFYKIIYEILEESQII